MIYDDFTAKVAAGRKLPLDKVRDVAKGRVWSGADAKTARAGGRLGRVLDGGGAGGRLSGIPTDDMIFRIYPRPTGLLGRLEEMSGGLDASLGVLGRVESLLDLPPFRAILRPGLQPACGRSWRDDPAQSRESAAPVTARDRRLQGNCLFPEALEL